MQAAKGFESRPTQRAWLARHCLLVAVALSAIACSGGEQQAIEGAVKRRLGDPPGLRVSEAVVFRSGDEKLACVSAKHNNNWDEPQPEVRMIAWYTFATKTWSVGNPRPVTDGRDCAEVAAAYDQAPTTQSEQIVLQPPPGSPGGVGGNATSQSAGAETTAAPEQKFSAEEQSLMAAASDAWAAFRDGAEAEGDRHGQALDELLTHNICWGRVDEPQALFAFHRCAPDSLQKQPQG